MQNYVGQQIDRYRITERLGMGGMAVVYKAYDTRLERDVALKLIRTESIPQDQHERLFKRFEREAKAQARFSHRNIVPVHDYGEVDGSPYLVMAFISGGTLKDRLHGPVDWRQAVRWLIPVAEALSYAHQRGIVHRDVKPGNILFDEEDQPILTDFGIAKILETDEATLTGTGLGVGTPEYMAPEQWQGKTSEATDQYALGVVLYELITGRKPYSADTPAAIILMQANEPLQAPSKIVNGIPEAVEEVLYKALARNPQDRYENMFAFTNALRRLWAKVENEGPIISNESSRSQEPSYSVNTHIFHANATYDVIDSTPPAGISQTLFNNKKKSKGIFKWVLWLAVGIIGVVLIGLFISKDYNFFNLTLDRKTDETVSIPTTSSKETNFPTTTKTLTPKIETETATISPTITSTFLPQGYFLLPDFTSSDIHSVLDFINSSSQDIIFQFRIFEGEDVGKIISQDPMPGEIITSNATVKLWIVGSREYILSNSGSNVVNFAKDIVIYAEPALNCLIEIAKWDQRNIISGTQKWISTSGCSYSYSILGEYNPKNIYLIEDEVGSINVSCVPVKANYNDRVPGIEPPWITTGKSTCNISLTLFRISN